MIGHNAMTEADYDAERARIRETYGDSEEEAGARWQQELARLFYRSGWTQQRLAEKEGKTQQWIALQVKFGQFLDFTTTVVNSKIGPAVTEGSFRECWKKTEGNDRERFQQAARLLSERTEVLVRRKQRPRIDGKLLDQFADGKWRRPEEIAEAIGTDADHVADAIESLGNRNRAEIEKRATGPTPGYGPGHRYRIFPHNETVGLVELKEKLSPIIKILKAQGNRPAGTLSSTAILGEAQKLQNLLDEWDERGRDRPARGPRSSKTTSAAEKDDVFQTREVRELASHS
jgi:hypothetical protein